MSLQAEYPLYNFWADYPARDKEYVRWYPPTLHPVAPEDVLAAVSRGPREMAFYMHVPFCKDICPYCPFNKFTLRADRAEAFLRGVRKEIAMYASSAASSGTEISDGYFGGGTPTALPIGDLLALVETTLGSFKIREGAELTIEANPDTVDEAALRALAGCGVNRISFGVQSFDSELLKTLGRTHGPQGAVRAIEMARMVGFENIAIDLIYRVPGQTLGRWCEDLDTAIRLGVDHVSTYCLFLDPGTRLYNATLAGKVQEYPGDDLEIAMYDATQDRLGAAGFEHYTINDFARSARKSAHHLANWQAPQQSYLALGPGAFGYVDGPEHGVIYCTIHALQDYLSALDQGMLPVRIANEVAQEEKRARYMVLGLRCLEVRKEPFLVLFGVSMDDVFGTTIADLVRDGLVTSDELRVRMTRRGMHYASNVLKAFYTEPNRRMPQPIGVELLAGRGASMLSVQRPPVLP